MTGKFSGPLFVMGVGRSGTKLIRNLLINHPKVYLTDEAGILPYMIRNWQEANFKNKKVFKKMYSDICGTSPMIVKQKKGQLISADEWYGTCKTYDFEGIMEAFTRYYTGFDKDSEVVWGDKTPTYNKHVSTLKKFLPNAKFIHIVRDVRDVCLSARKAWKSNLFQYAQVWYNDIKRCLKHFKDLDSSDYIEILYEDLITEPAEVMKQCFSFIGLGFSSEYLQLKKSLEPTGHAKDQDVIVKGNFGYYKKELSMEQIRRIESLTWPVLENYGYEYSYSGPLKKLSKGRLCWYKLVYSYGRFVCFLRNYGIKNFPFIMKKIFAKLKR